MVRLGVRKALFFSVAARLHGPCRAVAQRNIFIVAHHKIKQTKKKTKNCDLTHPENGSAGVSDMSLYDVRAGDHVVRTHVLPEVRRGLSPTQVSIMQREVQTKRGEKHQEQRLAHRYR